MVEVDRARQGGQLFAPGGQLQPERALQAGGAGRGGLQRPGGLFLGLGGLVCRLAAVISGGRLLAPTGPDLGSGVGVAGNTSRPWEGDP